jgi:hypothetical protein
MEAAGRTAVIAMGPVNGFSYATIATAAVPGKAHVTTAEEAEPILVRARSAEVLADTRIQAALA